MKKVDHEESKKSSKARRGVWKVLRVTNRKNYYAGGEMRQIKNRKLRLARHLRHFPEDIKNREVFAKHYSADALSSPLCAPIGRARRREARRQYIAAVKARKARGEVL
jgi:hypothetical protein